MAHDPCGRRGRGLCIECGSHVVSAKDKNGQRVMMLIGPTSTTMMKVPDDPSTAQVPDSSKDEIIQQ